jgi:hypothetical protein
MNHPPDPPTHYESLNVTREAPPELIRAAYHVLSRRYHPDLNPGDPVADRMMARVNAAYETLSDPRSRRDYDAWIAHQETLAWTARGGRRGAQGSATASGRDWARGPGWLLFTGAIVLAVALPTGGLAWWWSHAHSAVHEEQAAGESEAPAAGQSMAPAAGEPPPLATNESAARTGASPPFELPGSLPGGTDGGYIRPPRAPSGAPWPASSADVPGFKRLFDDGSATVLVDNAALPSDVYVKLYAERDTRPFAVRWLFIRAGDSFAVKDLRPGRYEIRYRALDTGAAAKTRPFELDAAAAAGRQGVNITVRLARPLPSQALPDTDF